MKGQRRSKPLPVDQSHTQAPTSASAAGSSVMGKVIEFKARKLVRNSKPMPERGMAGKAIEFRRQKSVDNSQNAGNRKADEAIAQAMFFWSFC
jgi:hypothetical protein